MSDETALEETESAVVVDDAREAMLADLTSELGDAIIEHHLKPGDDLWVRVSRDSWVATADVLRNKMRFGYFSFLSAIDWMPSPFGRDMDSQVDLTLNPVDAKDVEPMEWGYAGGETRFQVICRLHSISRHLGVLIKTDLADDDPRIETLVPVFPGANWHEREAMEMFGIGFDDHPDVRNIYLPGDFEGHPMRKDYPLLARRMKPWPGIVDVEVMPGDDS
jgi:NADH-quinone oxidoreductase subunit C